MCSPTGPGGVNNAWKYAVGPISGEVTEAMKASYVHDESCTAPNGLSIRVNTAGGDHLVVGRGREVEFTAPPDTQIVATRLWRYARVAQTEMQQAQGRWEGSSPRCPSAPRSVDHWARINASRARWATHCVRAGRARGSARGHCQLHARPKSTVWSSCGTDKGTVEGSPDRAVGAPAGEFALRASQVTIRDDVAPTVNAGAGPVR